MKITGWVFGTRIDPFYWIGQSTVGRNLKTYKRMKKNGQIRHSD